MKYSDCKVGVEVRVKDSCSAYPGWVGKIKSGRRSDGCVYVQFSIDFGCFYHPNDLLALNPPKPAAGFKRGDKVCFKRSTRKSVWTFEETCFGGFTLTRCDGQRHSFPGNPTEELEAFDNPPDSAKQPASTCWRVMFAAVPAPKFAVGDQLIRKGWSAPRRVQQICNNVYYFDGQYAGYSDDCVNPFVKVTAPKFVVGDWLIRKGWLAPRRVSKIDGRDYYFDGGCAGECSGYSDDCADPFIKVTELPAEGFAKFFEPKFKFGDKICHPAFGFGVVAVVVRVNADGSAEVAFDMPWSSKITHCLSREFLAKCRRLAD